MTQSRRPAHSGLGRGPPAASLFYLILGKVSWAQTQLQLPLLREANPRGCSFLPHTSITPGEQGGFFQRFPQKDAFLTPRLNEGGLEKPRFFTEWEFCFSPKYKFSRKYYRGLTKATPMPAVPNPALSPPPRAQPELLLTQGRTRSPSPTASQHPRTLTDSGSYSFSITHRIPELFLTQGCTCSPSPTASQHPRGETSSLQLRT